jgi:protein-S-isoprenylcysteine O-methyltransferase Ste14
MNLSLIVYSVLLAIYIAVMWQTPDRSPTSDDHKPPDEERFHKFALVIFALWWLSFALPFFTPTLSLCSEIYCAIIGIVIFAFGTTIRTIAIRTLGHNFTYLLCIRKQHQLIRSGIYRYIRHPSYTGTLLEVIGMMIAARSHYGLALFMASSIALFIVRIRREERLLSQHFGSEYIEYSRSTKRLIPWIF